MTTDIDDLITDDFLKTSLKQPLDALYDTVYKDICLAIGALSAKMGYEDGLHETYLSGVSRTLNSSPTSSKLVKWHSNQEEAPTKTLRDYINEIKAVLLGGVEQLYHVGKEILEGLHREGLLTQNALKALVDFKRKVIQLEGRDLEWLLLDATGGSM